MTHLSKLGLYLHIPWCPTRCLYCDFNTYVENEAALKQSYQAALLREIWETGKALDRPAVDTIFIGGGTPTTVPPAYLVELVETVRAAFQLQSRAEITTEANPEGLSVEYLQEIHQGGINRLSLGVQSFNDEALRFLSRRHDANTARQAIVQARRAGFDNLSLDLIFNLPDQTLAQWQFDLQEAIKLEPDHLSLYTLIIEPGTPLQHLVKAGQVPLPDDDIAAEMYSYAMAALAEAGYTQYEISNWARANNAWANDAWANNVRANNEAGWQTPRLAAAHNLIYWRNQPYLGLGAGAYSTFNGERWLNVKQPRPYIRRVQSGSGLGLARAKKSYERLDRATVMAEQMLLGLRLVREGVSATGFEARFGLSLAQHYPQAIAFGLDHNLLEWLETGHDTCLRLTQAGRFLANQAMMQFMA